MNQLLAKSASAGILAMVFVTLRPSLAHAEVTVERSEHGAVVKIDRELFAEYLMHVGHQPAVWPIIGPTSKPMTRQYPMGPLLPDEKDDHSHHVSLWFAHGNVNGIDFWTDRAKASAHKDNQIAHREFVTVEPVGGQAKIVTRKWRVILRTIDICQYIYMQVCG